MEILIVAECNVNTDTRHLSRCQNLILIVAECNVNLNYCTKVYKVIIILIVAECNVNEKSEEEIRNEAKF